MPDLDFDLSVEYDESEARLDILEHILPIAYYCGLGANIIFL